MLVFMKIIQLFRYCSSYNSLLILFIIIISLNLNISCFLFKNSQKKENFKYAHGGIIRGDISSKKLALIITGEEFNDGGKTIRNIKKYNRLKPVSFLQEILLQSRKFQIN